MKKRLIGSLLAGILCLGLLSGCGDKIPEGMSEEVYNNGVKLIEVIDQYLDLEIDEEEAKDKLDRLDSIFEMYDEQGDEDAFNLEINASYLEWKISKNDMEGLLEARNDTANILGLKERK